MKVLLTNIWLTRWGGTECATRDFARGLLRRGHAPIVYSPALGESAEEIQRYGIPVVDDVRLITDAPDVIHGHHLTPTAEAIIRFPRVPVINVCHAFLHWVEAPARFPQVQHFVAVDQACRERLLHAGGVDPARVVTEPNGVDLHRIPPRPRPLAETPARALAFTKNQAHLPVLEAVCAARGMTLDTLGDGVGRAVPRPEAELVNYDVVFATARSALEALCAGCAVIVADARGMAELVTPTNFDRLRERNFGLRALTYEVTESRVGAEIDAYSASAARVVSVRAREEASFERTLDRFVGLYDEAIARAADEPWTDSDHETAVSEFLFATLPRTPADPRWPWRAERDALLQRVGHLEHQVARLRAERENHTREVLALRASASDTPEA